MRSGSTYAMEAIPMQNTKLIAIECKISRGVVSDERAFEITMADGTPHEGVAPFYYFWDQEGKALGPNDLESDDEAIAKIAARRVDVRGKVVIVSVPDGAVVPVDVKTVFDRPTQVVINVPVRS